MIKLTSRYISLLLAVILAMTLQIEVYADNSININEAYKITVSHIAGDMKLGGESWERGIRVYNSQELADLDGKISAYLFEFVNSKNKPAGYVIVSAEKDEYPILEFSRNGEVFFKKALPLVENNLIQNYKDVNIKRDKTKIIHLGGIDYAVEVTLHNNDKKIYDITSPDIQIITKDDIYKLKNKVNVKDENILKVWSQFGDIDIKSLPSIPEREEIINPDDYESAYDSKNFKDVENIKPLGESNIQFKTTGNFKTINGVTYFNNCGPTAATNMMLYWYERDSTLYSSLYDNNHWKDVFVDMHTLIKTQRPDYYDNGSSPLNTYPAYEIFFNSKSGLECKSQYQSNPSWDDMKNEIDNNYPFHAHLRNSSRYTDHAVIALGYVEYQYGIDNPSYSRYLRIADGWVSSCDRFVHTVVNIDEVKMTTVHPKEVPTHTHNYGNWNVWTDIGMNVLHVENRLTLKIILGLKPHV